ESMIRPTLAETIGALSRALRSAHIEPKDIRNVLLVGGSSRIPLVAQLVSAELGRPVAVDAHPKHSIAYGAALAAEGFHREKTGAIPVIPPAEVPAPVAVVAPEPAPAGDAAPTPVIPAPAPVAVAEPIAAAAPAAPAPAAPAP